MNTTQDAAHLAHVDDATFDQYVLQAATPAAVIFSATWCGPCRIFEPIADAVAAGVEGRMRFFHLDSDASPQATARYGVRSMPTTLLFAGGEVVAQVVGAVPKARLEGVVAGVLGG